MKIVFRILKMIFQSTIFTVTLLFITAYILFIESLSWIKLPMLDQLTINYIDNPIVRLAVGMAIAIIFKKIFSKSYKKYIEHKINVLKKKVAIGLKKDGKEIIEVIGKFKKTHLFTIILDALLVGLLALLRLIENGELPNMLEQYGIHLSTATNVIIGLLVTSLIPEINAIIKNSKPSTDEVLEQIETEEEQKDFENAQNIVDSAIENIEKK